MELSSSQFAAAIGINPYQSRQKLAQVLRGEITVEINEFMQWGIDHEIDAVMAVEAETGLIFEQTGDAQRHHTLIIPDTDYWLGTTPDGLAEGIRTGLEVKCPQTLRDEVPAQYMPQIQGQMWIAELDAVIYAEWTEDETRIWQVAAHDEYVHWMSPLLLDFLDTVAAGKAIRRRKKPVPPTVATMRIK